MQMKAGAYIPLTHDCDAEKDLVFNFDDSIDVLTNAHFSWCSLTPTPISSPSVRSTSSAIPDTTQTLGLQPRCLLPSVSELFY